MPTERDLVHELKKMAETALVNESLEDAVRRGYMKHVVQSKRSRFRSRLAFSAVAVCGVLISGAIAVLGMSSHAQHAIASKPIVPRTTDTPPGTASGIQHAIQQGFGIPVDKSVSYDGVTVTATEAYFGSDRLWIGMKQTFAKSLNAQPRIRLAKVQLYIDGKLVRQPVKVEFEPGQGGAYVGGVEVDQLPQGLPKTITATVRFQKIGDTVSNRWTLAMTLSRSRSDAATRTLEVQTSKRFEGATFRINLFPGNQ